MSINIVRGAVTVALLLLFVLMWRQAWSGRRRDEYDAAARLPLIDDEILPEKR